MSTNATMQQVLAITYFATIFFSLEGTVHVMHYTNATSILSKLLNNYDKNVIPNTDGEAVIVKVQLYISDMVPLTSLHMHFSMDFFLRQEWNDSRLAFETASNASVLLLPGDARSALWVPDLYFPNGKESRQYEATTPNRAIHIYGSGKVFSSERLGVTSFCPMDLAYFPFDVQTCYFTIGSYAYQSQFLKLEWRYPNPVVRSNAKAPLHMKQYNKVEYDTESAVDLFQDIGSTDGNFETLRIRFKFYRDIRAHIFRDYIPCMLTVILSWMSFWIDYRSSPSRVALGVTTVLTMVTISRNLHLTLGSGSIFRSFDLYTLICNFYVFGVVIEYAVLGMTEPKSTEFWTCVKRKKRFPHAQSTPESFKHRGDINNYIKSETNFNGTDKVSSRKGVDDKKTDICDKMEANWLINDIEGNCVDLLESCKKNHPKLHHIDSRCRFLFPGTFVLFNICYFLFHFVMHDKSIVNQ